VVCVLLLGSFSSGWAYYNLDAALGTNTNEVSETDSSVPFVDLSVLRCRLKMRALG
jgi:hypothetical protein